MRKEKRLPWFKFYTTDFRTDPNLLLCSGFARCVWTYMLTFMHEAEVYGHLLIAGSQPSAVELAGLINLPADQVADAIAELERREVFSKTQRGIIYSRRMVDDEKKRLDGTRTGKRGGNPTLLKASTKSRTLNGQDNHTDNRGHNPTDNAHGRARTRDPEAREERTTVLSSMADGQDARPERSREAPRPALGGGPPAPLTLPSGVTWDRMASPEHPRYGTWFDRARPGRTWFEDMWGPPPGQPGSQVSAADLELILADHAAIATRSSP